MVTFEQQRVSRIKVVQGPVQIVQQDPERVVKALSAPKQGVESSNKTKTESQWTNNCKIHTHSTVYERDAAM